MARPDGKPNFLVKVRDKIINGRACANGSFQWEYMEREKATSPTTMMESVMITATSYKKQRPRDVITADIISNALGKWISEHIIMNIWCLVVNMLIEISPKTYEMLFMKETARSYTLGWSRHYIMAWYYYHCCIKKNFGRMLDSKSILMIHALQISLLMANSTQ